MATDLRDGEFWRTVWLFLIANASDFEPGQIAPMVDYIQAIRREESTFEVRTDATGFNSPKSAFSIKGRTVQSMLRLMQSWHRSLGRSSGAVFSWATSTVQPYLLEEPAWEESEPPRRWQITELTDSGQLRRESAELHHCVASYADRCYRGVSSIWSIRLWQGEKVHHVLTIEVDSKRRAVVQARGRANRAASGRSLRLLQDWAAREKLRIVL